MDSILFFEIIILYYVVNEFSSGWNYKVYTRAFSKRINLRAGTLLQNWRKMGFFRMALKFKFLLLICIIAALTSYYCYEQFCICNIVTTVRKKYVFEPARTKNLSAPAKRLYNPFWCISPILRIENLAVFTRYAPPFLFIFLYRRNTFREKK